MVLSLAIFEEKQVTIILPLSLLNKLSNDGSNSDSERDISFTPALVESPISKSYFHLLITDNFCNRRVSQ